MSIHKFNDGWQLCLPYFCLSRTDGNIWFRIFGKGLNIINRNKHKPLFSERMGFVKHLKIGKYTIKYLK